MTDYIQSSSELIARKSYQSKSLIKAIRSHTHTYKHRRRRRRRRKRRDVYRILASADGACRDRESVRTMDLKQPAKDELKEEEDVYIYVCVMSVCFKKLSYTQ